MDGQFLKDSGLFVVDKTIENETKEQRGGFGSALLDPLGARLLGNLLSGWISLYVNDNMHTSTALVFNSFKRNKKNIGNKNIRTNLFKIQTYESIMCGYFCIEFIEFIFKDESMTDFTNLFSPRSFEKKFEFFFFFGLEQTI